MVKNYKYLCGIFFCLTVFLLGLNYIIFLEITDKIDQIFMIKNKYIYILSTKGQFKKFLNLSRSIWKICACATALHILAKIVLWI